jgi:hypothetical protein
MQNQASSKKRSLEPSRVENVEVGIDVVIHGNMYSGVKPFQKKNKIDNDVGEAERLRIAAQSLHALAGQPTLVEQKQQLEEQRAILDKGAAFMRVIVV